MDGVIKPLIQDQTTSTLISNKKNQLFIIAHQPTNSQTAIHNLCQGFNIIQKLRIR